MNKEEQDDRICTHCSAVVYDYQNSETEYTSANQNVYCSEDCYYDHKDEMGDMA